MKRGLLAYFIAMLCISASASDKGRNIPKVTFGVEWSYSAAVLSGYHYNFYDPEGFRVNDLGVDWGYSTDGDMSFNLGYNFNEYWNMSLHAGYSGAGRYGKVIPVSIRATRFFGDSYLADRWFAFCDLGSGLSINERPREIYCGKIGNGYRLSLSRHTKLDFIAAFRLLYLHPDIFYYGANVSDAYINRDDGYLFSINVGLGLVF